MAKCKTTRKWIADNYNCVAVGYCDLQYLMNYQSPDHYTCGVYGWNFDCYTFEGYAITTGYRGMIDNCKNNFSYALAREYDDKARAIVNDWNFKGDKREAVNALLKEFLEKVFGHSVRVY